MIKKIALFFEMPQKILLVVNQRIYSSHLFMILFKGEKWGEEKSKETVS